MSNGVGVGFLLVLSGSASVPTAYQLSEASFFTNPAVSASFLYFLYVPEDMPSEPGDFTTRLEALGRLLPITAAPWVVAVPQQRATTY